MLKNAFFLPNLKVIDSLYFELKHCTMNNFSKIICVLIEIK